MHIATELFKLERGTVLNWPAKRELVLGFQGAAALRDVQIRTSSTESEDARRKKRMLRSTPFHPSTHFRNHVVEICFGPAPITDQLIEIIRSSRTRIDDVGFDWRFIQHICSWCRNWSSLWGRLNRWCSRPVCCHFGLPHPSWRSIRL